MEPIYWLKNGCNLIGGIFWVHKGWLINVAFVKIYKCDKCSEILKVLLYNEYKIHFDTTKYDKCHLENSNYYDDLCIDPYECHRHYQTYVIFLLPPSDM